MSWRVFYSYSHKDAELRDRLGTYLKPLVQQNKISEWHDRKIEPGADWNKEIADGLDTAQMILFLVSADFLASDYCFSVEVDKAMSRLKRGEVKIVPILLKPCLWEESRFSELQIIPRDAKAISSWTSMDDALLDVAREISKLTKESPPEAAEPSSEPSAAHKFDASLDLVRRQVRSYARLYERTRQRMRSSHERTSRMEDIFEKMRELASASYPLLNELAESPSPGDRLAAVAILQVFASEESLPFLVKQIGSEKPFVGYQAAQALLFAVGALEAKKYPELLESILQAKAALVSAGKPFDTDRQMTLEAAETELRKNIEALSETTENFESDPL
ncbi:MAG TPA: toll/interleukin-1 receptor domain-containing protein [Pyrinomonadaceae bacterium]|jgi:hypothetical protein